MKIKISNNADISFLYNEKLNKLQEIGKTIIKRASNVEPNSSNQWIVDLNPLGINKKLGPYITRQEALNAEKHIIESNYL